MNAGTEDNGTVNADYLITLRNNNSTLFVAVTITPNTSEFFISFINLAPAKPHPATNKPPAPLAFAANNFT